MSVSQREVCGKGPQLGQRGGRRGDVLKSTGQIDTGQSLQSPHVAALEPRQLLTVADTKAACAKAGFEIYCKSRCRRAALSLVEINPQHSASFCSTRPIYTSIYWVGRVTAQTEGFETSGQQAWLNRVWEV